MPEIKGLSALNSLNIPGGEITLGSNFVSP
jgi:hypothetical protein